jgi:hypothetical protein
MVDREELRIIGAILPGPAQAGWHPPMTTPALLLRQRYALARQRCWAARIDRDLSRIRTKSASTRVIRKRITDVDDLHYRTGPIRSTTVRGSERPSPRPRASADRLEAQACILCRRALI